MDNKHKTAMRGRCEVKCRHVTPNKLLRHKFIMFRKYFGRNSADYCGNESHRESLRNKVAACSLFLRLTPMRFRADVALDLFSSTRRKRFCQQFLLAQQEGSPDARSFFAVFASRFCVGMNILVSLFIVSFNRYVPLSRNFSFD